MQTGKLKQGGPSTDQQSMATFVTRQSKFDDKQHVEQTVALITKVIAQEMLQIISGPSEYCIFPGYIWNELAGRCLAQWLRWN